MKSSKPTKERKRQSEMPMHKLSKHKAAPVSKEMRIKYGRSLSVRKDDKVKILRGQHKGKIGKISHVDRLGESIFIEGVEQKKRDGGTASQPIHHSNVMIIDIGSDDKRRFKNKPIAKAK